MRFIKPKQKRSLLFVQRKIDLYNQGASLTDEILKPKFRIAQNNYVYRFKI